MVSGLVALLVAAAPSLGPEQYVAEDHADPPAIASNGEIWLVVWTDPREQDIYGARVRVADGVLLDSTPFPIAAHPGLQTDPAVAANGDHFLVAWTDRQDGDDAIRATRVLGRTVLDPAGFTVNDSPATEEVPEGSELPATQRQPKVAGGSGIWVVGWEDWRRAWGFNSEVFATRVSASAEVLDLDGVQLSVGDGDGDFLGSIAAGSDTFVLAMTNETSCFVASIDVMGSSQTERFVGGIFLAYGARRSAVAFDGSRFLAVWGQQDDRDAGYGIRARPLDATGAPVESAFWVSDVLVDDPMPAVTAIDGEFVVAWSDDRFRTESESHSAGIDVFIAVAPFDMEPTLAAEFGTYPAVADGYLVGWRGDDVFGRTISLEGDEPPPPPDGDGDGTPDSADNCPGIANADQLDGDDDGVGDACDLGDDSDGDGVDDEVDNCPLVANDDQLDTDGDGVGDVCDDTATDPGLDPPVLPELPNAGKPDGDDGDGDGDDGWGCRVAHPMPGSRGAAVAFVAFLAAALAPRTLRRARL